MSGTADELIAAIRRRRGGKKIEQAEVLRLFRDVAPSAGSATDRRRRLREVLVELRDRGEIRLGVDDGESPPLPVRVYRVDRPAEPAGTADPWYPALLPHAERAADPRGVLRAVSDWLFGLVGRPEPEPAPLRERALEITGDEKAFDSGLGPALTLDLLRAYRVVLPLHRERLGDGPVLLVVENSDTYDSLRRVLARDTGPVGGIAWGAGAAFTSSVLSVRDDPPAAIRYFGDLDAAGLRIPSAASALAEREGLPPVRPAGGLYTLLLAHGTRAGHAVVELDRARELAGWLDPAHRDAAAALLTGGGRFAQEACRRSILAADASWRSSLDGS